MRRREPTSIDDGIALIAKYRAEIEQLEARKLDRPEDAKATKKQWHNSLMGHIRIRQAEVIRLRAWVETERRKERPTRYAARNKELRQALKDAYSLLTHFADIVQLSHYERDKIFSIKQVLDADAVLACDENIAQQKGDVV